LRFLRVGERFAAGARDDCQQPNLQFGRVTFRSEIGLPRPEWLALRPAEDA
jgi:hypothetical protein